MRLEGSELPGTYALAGAILWVICLAAEFGPREVDLPLLSGLLVLVLVLVEAEGSASD